MLQKLINKINSEIVKDDLIARNSNFVIRKHGRLEEMKREKDEEFRYKPKLISKPYREGTEIENIPVQERLYNKATEYELKKEEMRRNQVDSN